MRCSAAWSLSLAPVLGVVAGMGDETMDSRLTVVELRLPEQGVLAPGTVEYLRRAARNQAGSGIPAVIH